MSYEHRKAFALLRVRDADGRPAARRRLRLDQTEHDFLFGCGAFDAIVYANGRQDDPFCRDRMEKWLALFNYGTMSFYWGRYEPEEGKPEFESRMNASRFLAERDRKVKGHPLCWHTVCADWLLKYDDKTILDKQLERIHRDVSAFAGVIDMWDVINEVVIMPEFDRYDNAITRVCRRYGRVPLVKEVFDAAKTANPHALLLINDFNLSCDYARLIRDCLDAGAPIGAIGLQTHQHQGYMGAEKLGEVLRRYEGFGLPLHFTENTLVSGHLMPPHIVDLNDYQVPEWPTTPEGEAQQSREWEEMYRILFAHPRVEAVTGWDFADGGWLGAPSGIIAADNREKPVYHTLNRLIHGEWETHCEVVTDENGCAEISGFKGRYALSDGVRGASLRLDGSAETVDAILA
ncbi:MAG: endo-1,4-beta-xylanase [Clostridia bacterium]|nr:endo-1,4-beta-xylanase [Clostridia bacterium]